MKRTESDAKENVGKFLLDISKLTFASFILGGILLGELPQYMLIAIGFVVSIGCAIIGILWTSKKSVKHKE